MRISDETLDQYAYRAVRSLNSMVDAFEAREQEMSKRSVEAKAGKQGSGDKARPPSVTGEVRRTERPTPPPPTNGWRGLALCVRTDLDFLTVIRGSLKIQRQRMERQLATCDVCTVKVECLEFALETEQPLGIWGGKLPAERRAG